jgi:hypothetical protein
VVNLVLDLFRLAGFCARAGGAPVRGAKLLGSAPSRNRSRLEIMSGMHRQWCRNG